MGRIVIVENKATGKTRTIDRSLPKPVIKTSKPITFYNEPIQSSVFTQSIRCDDWNSSHQDPPRSWKYWYGKAARQFDRPDLEKRSKKTVYPSIRALYDKGLCIYPRIFHFPRRNYYAKQFEQYFGESH